MDRTETHSSLQRKIKLIYYYKNTRKMANQSYVKSNKALDVIESNIIKFIKHNKHRKLIGRFTQFRIFS